MNWYKVSKTFNFIPGLYWVDPKGDIYDIRDDGCNAHAQWVYHNEDFLKDNYDIDIDKSSGGVDQLVDNGWIRLSYGTGVLNISVQNILSPSQLALVSDIIVSILIYGSFDKNSPITIESQSTAVNYVSFTPIDFVKSDFVDIKDFILSHYKSSMEIF